MKRGPQQRGRVVYQGYLIEAQRLFGWLIAFEITRLRDGYPFASGHTDEHLSTRLFITHLKAWLDGELAIVSTPVRKAA